MTHPLTLLLASALILVYLLTRGAAPAPVPTTIVAAVGTAAGSKDRGLAKAIETAMADAVTHAITQGISDPDQIRGLMLAAREAVKAARR